jgi:hypothetical protein
MTYFERKKMSLPYLGLNQLTENLWMNFSARGKISNRIRIGNPDPGSGSRGKKIKKYQWKNALFSYLKKFTTIKV